MSTQVDPSELPPIMYTSSGRSVRIPQSKYYKNRLAQAPKGPYAADTSGAYSTKTSEETVPSYFSSTSFRFMPTNDPPKETEKVIQERIPHDEVSEKLEEWYPMCEKVLDRVRKLKEREEGSSQSILSENSTPSRTSTAAEELAKTILKLRTRLKNYQARRAQQGDPAAILTIELEDSQNFSSIDSTKSLLFCDTFMASDESLDK